MQMEWQRQSQKSLPVQCQPPPPSMAAPASHEVHACVPAARGVPAWMEPTRQANESTFLAAVAQWRSSPSRAMVIDQLRHLLRKCPAPPQAAGGLAAARPAAVPRTCGRCSGGFAAGLQGGRGRGEKTLMVHNIPSESTVERLMEDRLSTSELWPEGRCL